MVHRHWETSTVFRVSHNRPNSLKPLFPPQAKGVNDPPQSTEVPRLSWWQHINHQICFWGVISASESTMSPWVSVRWTSSPDLQLPSSLLKIINTPSMFWGNPSHQIWPSWSPQTNINLPRVTPRHRLLDKRVLSHRKNMGLWSCHLIMMTGSKATGTPTHCCHCPMDSGCGMKTHRHPQGRMIYLQNQVWVSCLLHDTRIPHQREKGCQDWARGLHRAAGKFSSHLSEHGFSLKSSPNICSHRTLTCCRCLQTPEVKNQEQSWCEPLWETHPVWVNPLDSVLLNSECPDFLHKYTSIFLWAAPTLCVSHEKNN